MEMQPLSQGHPPWGVAMYTNLQHYQSQYEREQLFEKPLTPSDVGKLNRLVIPKQHAERYFPLGGAGGGGDAGDKGLLLSFEDEAGKPWRFRYSYWTSSQSYVLTKGWSRFVREKGLRAGDTIVFSCSAYGPEKQLFIDCKMNRTTCSTGGDATPPEKQKESRVVRLFGVDIAGDGCQKKGRAVEIALEQGRECFKRPCVGAHQHSPLALGAFVL